MEHVLGTGVLYRTQYELSIFKNLLTTLEFWLENISRDEDLLGVLHLEDFEGRIRTLKEQWKDENIPMPLEIIENLKREIEASIEKKIVNQPLDEEIVNQEINQVKEKLLLSMNPYSVFINSSIKEDKSYNLNSSQIQLYNNTAFQKNTAVSHVGMADAMLNSIWQSFTHYFSSAFFVEHQKVDYSIDSSILFKACDKLLGKSNEYLVVCFGVYLDYYLNQIDGLEKSDSGDYLYNGTTILSLNCPTKVFSQRIYILKKNQLPKLSFKSPIKAHGLKEVLKSYALWLGVEKVKDTNEDLPKHILEEIGEQREKFCLFKSYWNPVLYFSSATEMICLKVNYKMIDEGNWNSLNDIRPL